MLDEIMSGSEETSFYTILDDILFFPDEQYIFNIKTFYRVNLKSTVSQCFHLLLKRRGNIVSQNELMAYAWGEKHRQVSYNTFYQNILQLRRALLMAGLEQQIITTVPRKGVMIHADILVKIEMVTGEKPSTQQNLPPIVSSSEATGIKSSHSKIFMRYGWFVLLLITLMCLLSYFLREFKEKDFFSNYYSASFAETNCHVFFNNDVANHEKHDLFIKSHQELCHKNKYIYITASPNTHNISAIICPVRIGPKSNKSCISLYYPWYQYEAK